MKKVLDFSRVPLDKWVELFTQVCNTKAVSSGILRVFDDIEQLATTEVNEEADINAELVEKLRILLDSNSRDEEYVYKISSEAESLFEQKKALKESENKSEREQKERDKNGEPG